MTFKNCDQVCADFICFGIGSPLQVLLGCAAMPGGRSACRPSPTSRERCWSTTCRLWMRLSGSPVSTRYKEDIYLIAGSTELSHTDIRNPFVLYIWSVYFLVLLIFVFSLVYFICKNKIYTQ